MLQSTVKLVPFNHSIVVVANEYNPSFLHSAVLSLHAVVPSDWKVVGEAMCSPAISVIPYDKRVGIMLDTNKLTIRDEAPAGRDTAMLPTLAIGVLSVLPPSAKYTSVGVNIGLYFACPDAEKFVAERFLRAGPGNEGALKPQATVIKLTYPVPDGILNLRCEGGNVENNGKKEQCVILNANYHMKLQPPTLESVRRAATTFGDRLEHLRQTVDIIFGKPN